MRPCARVDDSRPTQPDAAAATAAPVDGLNRLYSMLPFPPALAAMRPRAASEATAAPPLAALPNATLGDDEMLSMLELSELQELDVFQMANQAAQDAACSQQSLKDLVSYLADQP